MKTVILACNTIRDELEKAAMETNCPYEFVWVESGLHLVPDSLRRRLQEELDKIGGVNQSTSGIRLLRQRSARTEIRRLSDGHPQSG